MEGKREVFLPLLGAEGTEEGFVRDSGIGEVFEDWEREKLPTSEIRYIACDGDSKFSCSSRIWKALRAMIIE